MLETRLDQIADNWLIGYESRFGQLQAHDSLHNSTGHFVGSVPHLQTNLRGVSAYLQSRPIAWRGKPTPAESEAFLHLYRTLLYSFQPDIVINFGGDQISESIRIAARQAGAFAIFHLHNFNYHSTALFETADAVIVPSFFAKMHYKATLGLECTVLPNLLYMERARCKSRNPSYVTFVNPSPEKGVFFFSRIAEEMGKLRPDIPLLVVESRGSDATLVNGGIDLRSHNNVFLMSQTPDPSDFWSVTRVCLLPSL